jgi:hypothetical protein
VQFERAFAAGRDILDPLQLGGILQGLALCLMALHEDDQAFRTVNESIDLSKKAGDTYNRLFGLTMRGVLRNRMGDTAAGWQDHQEALGEAVAIGLIQGLALTIELVGLDAALAGDFETAAFLGAGALRVRAEGGGGPSISSAGYALPGTLAAEHLPAPEADRLAAEGRAAATDDLVRRARAWLADALAAAATVASGA